MKKPAILLVSFAALLVLDKPAYCADWPQKNHAEVSRKIIQRKDIAGTDEELRLMLVEFPSSYASPAHTHPVVGLNYILEGVAESQYEGEGLKALNAGDSYQDPAHQKHLIFRNPSKTNVLRFLVAYKIKKDGAFMHPLQSE